MPSARSEGHGGAHCREQFVAPRGCLCRAKATNGRNTRIQRRIPDKGTLMKRAIFLTPFVLAAMAGCAPAPNQIQAGQWELVTEVVSLDVPGATADQQRQIRQQVGTRQSPPPQCISETEARTLVENMRRAPPTCRVSDETYAGGVMRTHLTCPPQAPGQPEISLAVHGTF